MMIKKIICHSVFAILFVLPKITNAQNTKAYKEIERALISYLPNKGSLVLSNTDKKDKAYIFSAVISLNGKGKIESVHYSDCSKELDSLISFVTITDQLKKKRLCF